MGETLSTSTSRIRGALNNLTRHGVSEEMVRENSHLSPELWQRFAVSTTDTPASLDGIKMLEVVYLADALLVDVNYLITGDRSDSIRYSPCGLAQIIAGRYPDAINPSTDHEEEDAHHE